MSFNLLRSRNLSLLVAGIVMLSVGMYTGNGGIQLAGGMLCFISLVLFLGGRGKRDS